MALDVAGTLDVSALDDAHVDELSGSGTVKGNVSIGQFDPGSAASATGTLTFRNNLVLGSGSTAVTRMAVTKDATGLSGDFVDVAGELTLGGAFILTRSGDDLVLGDQFNLFNAASFSGVFATFNLPALSPGLRWDTSRLAVDGTLSVIAFTNHAPVAEADTAVVRYEWWTEIHVLANDTDLDGDTLTITSVDNAAHGTVEIIPTSGGQRVRYITSAGFSGADSFTYSIVDGFGGSAVGTVNVTVKQPNRPPHAQNDAALVSYESATDIHVLANDTDPDGDTLAITSAQNAAHGTVQIISTSSGQRVRYTAAAGFWVRTALPTTSLTASAEATLAQ